MKAAHYCLLGVAVVGVGGLVLLESPRLHAADAPTSQPVASAGPATKPTTRPAVAVNKHCPVSGDAIDPTVTVVYKGKTYAFCCADCVKTFNKDPDKYVALAK